MPRGREQGCGTSRQKHGEEDIELTDISQFLQGCGIACALLWQPRKAVDLASAAYALASLTLLDLEMFRMGHPGGEHGVFAGSS